MSRTLATIVAIVIGAALAPLLIWCWAHIAAMNPIPLLLAENGLTGPEFWTAVAATDFMINVVLFIPAAWTLWRLCARHIHLNTLLTVISFAITSAAIGGLPLFSYGLFIWANYILLLAALPVAVLLLSRFFGNAPNKSFKPTPLRGAA